MKKITLILWVFIALLFQSCSVDSQVTLHKDSTSSILSDIDFSDLVALSQSKDSTNFTKSSKYDDVPRDWTSLYDVMKKEKKDDLKDLDSIKLMKNFFIKGNFTEDYFSGVSIKINRVNEEEIKMLQKLSSEKDWEMMPISGNGFYTWNGKTLVIETEMMSPQNILDNATKNINKQEEKQVDNTKNMLDIMAIMMKKYTIKLNFESPIQSIKGKHDWIKQLDKNTVMIEYDTSNLDEKKPMKHKDKKVIITTR